MFSLLHCYNPLIPLLPIIACYQLGNLQMSQDQRGAEQISQINDAADCVGSLDLTCMRCDKRVSVAEHLHNLSPFSLHSMIEVSAKAWHATPYIIASWQYLPRLGKVGISLGLACYAISCHALAVSAEAWHAMLC